MIKLFEYIIMHFSGATWFEHVRTDMASLEIFAIIFYIVVGLSLLISTINFIIAGMDGDIRWFPYIPFILLYFLINTLHFLILTIIFSTIGGFIGLAIGGTIYALLLLITGAINIDEAGEIEGNFKLQEWIIEYSKIYGNFLNERIRTKTNYKKYLNTNYLK